MTEVHEEEHLSLLRRFQRPILLGLVIFALLTFSITQAALMIFETDPTTIAIVLPDGKSATIGGRTEEELERASFGIVGQIVQHMVMKKDQLDRAGEEANKSDQVLQSLQEFREFAVWVPFYERVEGTSQRNRDVGVSHDDYTILSGAAQAAGIRFDGEVIAEKTQALLQLMRSAGGERAAELDEAQLHRIFNLRPAGFEVAIGRALAATELVRRLELGLEAVPTPEEVLEGWKKANPEIRATVAVFAASLYEEEARKVFELLFPTEEERAAEIRRWKEPQVGDEPVAVDDATKTRRDKVRVEDLDKRKDAAEEELAQAIEAQGKAPAEDEAAAARVRTARRNLLWVSYLDKLVDRRTHYGAAKDDGSASTKDALKDFEGRRWLLFGLDLDSMTETQEAFLVTWLKEKQIEEPTLKEIADHYRKYANSRFLTEEGRLSRNVGRWVSRSGGAMPRAQEGAPQQPASEPQATPKEGAAGEAGAAGGASGAGSGQGGESAPTPAAAPAEAGGPQAGPAPAVPEGMLATSDRPDMPVSKDLRGWDDPGVQFQARRDLIVKRFLTRFLETSVSPALEDATKAERVVLAEAETALTEKTKVVDALMQRAREITTELNSGGDGRGLIRYIELKRAEDSAKAGRNEGKAQVERLEKLPEAQREADYAQKLEDAKKRLQSSEQELAQAGEALKTYLVEGLPRVRASLLNGRAAGVTSALSMLGFGELVAKSGEPAPAEAATQALNSAWGALGAAEQNAVGGAAAWDAADMDAKLALLVRATSSVASHPQAGAVDAAWRAVARAKLSAIVTPVETKRAELQSAVAPAATSLAEGVDRLSALRTEIPALEASIAAQDLSLAAKRDEAQRETDEEKKKKLEAEIESLRIARDAQAGDRATKVEERGKLETERTTLEQAFETQRAAAFEAGAGWAEALGALEATLRAIELADPGVAAFEARSVAVADAEKKVADAEAANADVSTLDRLRVDLVALVERRLEAYERRRTLSSQATTRATEVRNAYAEWREALDPAHATQLQSQLVEYSDWGAKNADATKAQADAQVAVEAAKNGVNGARIAALPVVLERMRSEMKTQSGAAALDLVIQEVPGWVTREDLRKDFERASNDMPESGGNPILEGALFGPAGQLEEGALGKSVAFSQRYAFVPGLLDAGGEHATDALARRGYLRELALEIARIRAAICSEMLDEAERLNETEAETTFAPGSEVKREEFERELKEGEAFYLVKGSELPSQEIRFQRHRQSWQGMTYDSYNWNFGPINPDWFRRVTSMPVRRTFDTLRMHLKDVEGEVLSAHPFEQPELESWFVAHLSRRPLDPEADGARISPRDWMSAFKDLRTERMAKAVRSHLTGDGLRKTFQIARR